MAELGSGITYHVATNDRPLKFHSVQRHVSPDGVDPDRFRRGKRQHFYQPGAADSGSRASGSWTMNSRSFSKTPSGTCRFGARRFRRDISATRRPTRVFHADGWFETGDLGFLSDGELVITGRAKENIIVRGVNYACSEIEEAVSSVPGVEPSFTAACAVHRPGASREELAVFFHTAADEERRLADVLREIQQCLVRQMGVRPDFLLPVPKEAIPKTAIGKLQRAELSRRFAAGEFAAVLARVAELQRRQTDMAAGEHNRSRTAKSKSRSPRSGRKSSASSRSDFTTISSTWAAIPCCWRRMHIKLQQHFGPRITLVEMFNYPTIHALANFLSGSSGRGAAAATTSGQQTRRKQRDLSTGGRRPRTTSR